MDGMRAARIRALRMQYEDVEREAARCEKDVEDARYWVEFRKSEIEEYRELANAKFDEMRDSWDSGDRAYAEILKEEGQLLNNETDDKREELKMCYEELDEAKERWKEASRRMREIKRELEIELGQGDWRRKPCKECGQPITYRIDWEHIPNYCRDCKERFSSLKRRSRQS